MYGSSRLGTLGANIVLSDTALRDSAYFAAHDTSTNPFTDSVTYFAAGLKQYEFTNHLGNVLLTLTDRHTPFYLYGVSYLPEIASAQDYYPFGMEMVGRAYNPALYRFGFNNKEKDNEIEGIGNSIDFGARIYDSRLSRWFSIDPLQKKYPGESHYDFAMNSPIFLKDVGGKDVFAYDVASQDIVLKTVAYLFGKNNGFEFENNKLVHKGQAPAKMPDNQKLLYKYFTETILVSKIPVTVHANEDVLLTEKGDVEKVPDGNGRTVQKETEDEFSPVDNGQGMMKTYRLDKLGRVTNDILLTKRLMEDGINVGTENGVETFSTEHSLAHEFAHAMVNVIMKEFKGQFNGVDFTKMTSIQREDWAIRYTNTLLKGKFLAPQENGAGQHGRTQNVKAAPADVTPITQ